MRLSFLLTFCFSYWCGTLIQLSDLHKFQALTCLNSRLFDPPPKQTTETLFFFAAYQKDLFSPFPGLEDALPLFRDLSLLLNEFITKSLNR